ncbi:hypothetical protein DWZ60_09500 [Blautia sp. AF34-10]|uniref:hypothetical protein n=1 Tax=Blautia sp. AF34-10 TaxID=2292968 RepID=UPI000E5C5D5A|nr:hypothetical protein [Blautia sp. AF34-10]RHP35834.1 hypothetical protein DWZ60_09500 [Blautia sp. AF34-10]
MKKRNMKVLALLMTVTMAGTMLAGCGDSGSTSTGSSGGTTASSGGTTASSSGTADASSDATAASSSTADASSEDTTGSDDVVGELQEMKLFTSQDSSGVPSTITTQCPQTQTMQWL